MLGYLSHGLNTAAKGWSACLRAVAAVALLGLEPSKLTLGKDLTVHTPHNVAGVLSSQGSLWLSDN